MEERNPSFDEIMKSVYEREQEEKRNKKMDRIAEEIRVRTEQENNQYWRDKSEQESSVRKTNRESGDYSQDILNRGCKVGVEYNIPEYRLDLLPAILLVIAFFTTVFVTMYIYNVLCEIVARYVV